MGSNGSNGALFRQLLVCLVCPAAGARARAFARACKHVCSAHIPTQAPKLRCYCGPKGLQLRDALLPRCYRCARLFRQCQAVRELQKQLQLAPDAELVDATLTRASHTPTRTHSYSYSVMHRDTSIRARTHTRVRTHTHRTMRASAEGSSLSRSAATDRHVAAVGGRACAGPSGN